jgi:hypothetical protein
LWWLLAAKARRGEPAQVLLGVFIGLLAGQKNCPKGQ